MTERERDETERLLREIRQRRMARQQLRVDRAHWWRVANVLGVFALGLATLYIICDTALRLMGVR